MLFLQNHKNEYENIITYLYYFLKVRSLIFINFNFSFLIFNRFSPPCIIKRERFDMKIYSLMFLQKQNFVLSLGTQPWIHILV